MDEVRPEEATTVVDPSVAIAVALAELELVRTSLALATVEDVGPPEPVIRDLSPIGQTRP
jgi:hypothetical protein